MIVRCNNCVSAFSVDDDKVANKVFAFACPKCGAENIVDNKIKNKLNLEIEESSFDLDDTPSSPSDEFDIELKEDRDIAKDEKDSIFDDFDDGNLGSADDISQNNDDIDKLLMESGIDSEMKETVSDDDLLIDLSTSDTASAGDDLTIDMDNLDIELEETSSDDISSEHAKKSFDKESFDDEDIKLNLDELDIDIDTVDSVEDTELISKDSDDLTIDMDNLDIELEETYPDDILADHATVSDKKNIKTKLPEDEFDDEDIKLNLDELDIDIDVIDVIEDRKPSKDKVPVKMAKSADNEDDERLSLEDAGLTFDELTQSADNNEFNSELGDEFNELSEDEIKLTLEDIDPDLTLEEIMKSAETDNKLVVDSLEEFPEIYTDEYEAAAQAKSNKAKSAANLHKNETSVYNADYDNLNYNEPKRPRASHRKRRTFFSIDFSLKYSRLQAFLRLIALYFISMIPHFIVLVIYSILSSILGLINQLVIFATGRCVEDFARIIENTLRYILYIHTNLIGIIDDRPVYAGRQHMDHPLLFNVTFPSEYSKKMAILRLSIIGITIFTLPHIIILTLLSLTMPICYLVGILSVIITRRWPNILFRYLSGYFKYLAKTCSFMLGLTDDYPPFRL